VDVDAVDGSSAAGVGMSEERKWLNTSYIC
jgi:hypothetical protein